MVQRNVKKNYFRTPTQTENRSCEHPGEARRLEFHWFIHILNSIYNSQYLKKNMNRRVVSVQPVQLLTVNHVGNFWFVFHSYKIVSQNLTSLVLTLEKWSFFD